MPLKSLFFVSFIELFVSFMSTTQESSFELIIVGLLCFHIQLCSIKNKCLSWNHFFSKEKAHISVVSLKKGFMY